MKVLIADRSDNVCATLLRQAGHDVDENTGLAPDELKSIIGNYHGLVVRSATKVTADLLSEADNMQVIGRAGTGVDNIDLQAASEKGIVVMNTPGGNSNAVAEICLGQMIGLARSLYQACASVKQGHWDKNKFAGSEIAGKTLGVIGYGRVSRLLSVKGLALGMKVLAYDPKIGKSFLDQAGIEITHSLGSLLRTSDYISIHLTRRPENLNFLAREQFEMMKKGVYLLNYARGGLVNEKDLKWALHEGIVAGAALDVFEKEPPKDHPLLSHPAVVFTPHLGAASEESQQNVARHVAEQFIDFFAGTEVRNAVNQDMI